ncbi:MAG TPA: hypothetical protein VNT60_08915 [Deinococcales bacterium]|nr:hypothetical protein [Deinococcales bacterium]
MNAEKVAKGLGWFSIALGAAEVIAPGAIANYLGLEKRGGLVRAYGVRELAAGAALLAQPSSSLWVWSRVAGDAIDMVTLGGGLKGNPRAARAGVALAMVAGITLVDVLTASTLGAKQTN